MMSKISFGRFSEEGPEAGILFGSPNFLFKRSSSREFERISLMLRIELRGVICSWDRVAVSCY